MTFLSPISEGVPQFGLEHSTERNPFWPRLSWRFCINTEPAIMSSPRSLERQSKRRENTQRVEPLKPIDLNSSNPKLGAVTHLNAGVQLLCDLPR